MRQRRWSAWVLSYPSFSPLTVAPSMAIFSTGVLAARPLLPKAAQQASSATASLAHTTNMRVMHHLPVLISTRPATTGGEVTLDSLTSFRSHRFDTQIANNPDFFNGPFSGVLVQPAAYTFIYRFMANHSSEFPVGKLTYDVIQSWFGVQGSNGQYNAVQGSERIPENWVCRCVDSFVKDLC